MRKEWFIKEGGQVCFKSEDCELNGWDIQSLVDCLNGKEIKIAKLEEQLKKSLESNNDFLRQIMDLQSQLIVERLKGE